MAMTRNFLKSLGLNDDQVQTVLDEHVSVTEALRGFKADAEKLPTVQKELDDLKKSTADYEQIKDDLAKEKKAFSDYKVEIENQNTMNKLKDAYKALLKAQKVDDKRLDAILRLTDFTSMRLDKEGKLEKESDLVESIKKEWGDFIVTTQKQGAPVENPPTNNNDSGLDANAKFIRERASRKHASTYGEMKGE